jgi:uncharacterized protein YceK
MSPHERRSRLLLAAAACTAAVLAGCSTAPTAPTAGASPTGSASYGELTEAFLAYARCARTHGMPDLPDPVVDQQGNDSYPALDAAGHWSWPQSVLRGCSSVWDHVHEVRARYDSSHGLAARAQGALSPAQELAFAQCVRLHGFPTYPDPGPDGTVQNPPPGFSKPNLSVAARTAILACQPQTSHG